MPDLSAYPTCPPTRSSHSDVLFSRMRPTSYNPCVPELRFDPAPHSVAQVRRFVRAALDRAGAGAEEWPVVQIASELATNAIVHAATSFVVRVAVNETRVRIEVIDEAPHARAVRRAFSDAATTGRGLRLVEELARVWGEEVGQSTKTVWCEVTRTSGDPGSGLKTDIDSNDAFGGAHPDGFPRVRRRSTDTGANQRLLGLGRLLRAA